MELINLDYLNDLDKKLKEILLNLENDLESIKSNLKETKEVINSSIKTGKISFTTTQNIEKEVRRLVSSYSMVNDEIQKINSIQKDIKDFSIEFNLELGKSIEKAIDFGKSITNSDKQYNSLLKTSTNVLDSISKINISFSKVKESITNVRERFKLFLTDLNNAKSLSSKIKIGLNFGKETIQNTFKGLGKSVGVAGKDIASLVLDYLSQFKNLFKPIINEVQVLNEQITLLVGAIVSGNLKDLSLKLKQIRKDVLESIKLEQELEIITVSNSNKILSIQNKINSNNNTITSIFAGFNDLIKLTIQNYELQKEIITNNIQTLEKEIELEERKYSIYVKQNKVLEANQTKLKIEGLKNNLEGLKISIEGIDGTLNDFKKKNLLDKVVLSFDIQINKIKKDLEKLDEYLNNQFTSLDNKEKSVDINLEKNKTIFERNIKAIASFSSQKLDLNNLFERFNSSDELKAYLQNLNVEVALIDTIISKFDEYLSLINGLKDTKKSIRIERDMRNATADIDVKKLKVETNINFIKNQIEDLDTFFENTELQLTDYIKELNNFYSKLIKETENYYDILLDNENLTLIEREKILKEREVQIDSLRRELQVKTNDKLINQFKKEKDLLEQINQLEIQRNKEVNEYKKKILEQNVIKNYLKILNLLKEQINYEKQLLEIEKEKELRTAKTDTEIKQIEQKYDILFSNLELKFEQNARDLRNSLKGAVTDFFGNLFSEIETQYNRKLDLINERLDRDREYYLNALDYEKEKALLGIENNLSDFEAKIVEIEAKKRENEKQRRLQELVFSFLQAYNSYLKNSNPQEALANALKDVFIIKAFASQIAGVPMFAKGIENFKGVGTETSDSNLVRISKGESIITAKATKNYAGLATAMNKNKVDEWFNKNNLQINLQPNNQNEIKLDVFKEILEIVKKENIKTIRRLK